MADVWELLENPPHGCETTASLYSWSLNFDPGKGPFALFLDLLGWSADEIGEPLYSLKDASLGYIELNHLGHALAEYADDPPAVREFVAQLMVAEAQG